MSLPESGRFRIQTNLQEIAEGAEIDPERVAPRNTRITRKDRFRVFRGQTLRLGWIVLCTLRVLLCEVALFLWLRRPVTAHPML